MKFLKDESTKNYFLLITYAIVLAYVFLNLGTVGSVIGAILGYLSPFIIGACMAFVINLPMKAYEDRLLSKFIKNNKSKLKRPLALILTILSIVLLIVGLITFVVPQLVESASTLVKNVPQYAQSLENFLTEQFNNSGLLNQDFVNDMYNKIVSMGEDIIAIVGQLVGTIFSHALDITIGVTSTIVNVVLAFIVSIYILLSKEKLSLQIKKIFYAYLSKEKVKKILKVAAISNIKFSRFVTGQCIEAVILAILCFIGMGIFKMPYTLLISTIIGVTALVPIFGAFAGAVLSGFIVVMVQPEKLILFIIIFIVIQQIEGNLIYPFVVGNSIGLSALWVLFAITVGGNSAGVLGMLLGVPLFGVLYTVLSIVTNNRLKKRNIDINAIEEELKKEVEEVTQDNDDDKRQDEKLNNKQKEKSN